MKNCYHDYQLVEIVEDEYYYRCSVCGEWDIS
jgi:predicted restriction endonuclease